MEESTSNREREESTSTTLSILSIPVKFPYAKAYGTQMAFMTSVIKALDNHSHALLESPTGTGKSVSLLCAVLAWRESMTSPGAQRKAPLVVYASRTHGQLAQVINEYKKSSYWIPTAVLGSRKQLCTNDSIRGEVNVDELCGWLLSEEDSCKEYKNFQMVKAHSLPSNGCSRPVLDIEDSVDIGLRVKGCSYFASRAMVEEAELIFCPYDYIINPGIREGHKINLPGSIIILDEAHNIDDVARECGSIDLEEEYLLELKTDLVQLSMIDDMTYQPLLEMTKGILGWIDRRKNTLGSDVKCRCWTGEEALKELEDASISLQNFGNLQDCAKKAIKAATEAKSDMHRLRRKVSLLLKGFFSTLCYFFSEIHSFDLALQRASKKVEDVWTSTYTFSLWCLYPAVVFKGIAELAQSMILTSGTLSPLNTFSSELGVKFDTSLQAQHVINVKSQVWAAVISTGPNAQPLNGNFSSADKIEYQDAVGRSLAEIYKVVPGGCLVFFPSYRLLKILIDRWKLTGQWIQLEAQKSIFVESRGVGQHSIEATLKEYDDCIINRTSKSEGATFLAVCRGKVSEGIDFSNDKARAVVIVGIPFANINDDKVKQKKRFNDTYKSSKHLIGGEEWYIQQAFRAVNQAAGRCIRHSKDYGAIIYLDERFERNLYRQYLSKWLQNSVRSYIDFNTSIQSLKSFFDGHNS